MIAMAYRLNHYSVKKAGIPVNTVWKNSTVPRQNDVLCRCSSVSVAVYLVLVILFDAQVTLCDGE